MGWVRGSIVPSYMAVLLSVTFVLIFGEIIPQAHTHHPAASNPPSSRSPPPLLQPSDAPREAGGGG